MKLNKEERVRRAEELFMQGYNCSQSVVAAFADIYGYTEEQALKLSAGFGGGIGRMRMTCGAACGMVTLAWTAGPLRQATVKASRSTIAWCNS